MQFGRYLALSLGACTLGVFACAVSRPAVGANEPKFIVDIINTNSGPHGVCKVRFAAQIDSENWPAGMDHTITYHWELRGKRYRDHTWTLTEGQEPKESAGLTVTAPKGFTGHITFVITKPVHYVHDSGPEAIGCL